jgi:hypothetical protein
MEYLDFYCLRNAKKALLHKSNESDVVNRVFGPKGPWSRILRTNLKPFEFLNGTLRHGIKVFSLGIQWV